MTYLKPQSTQQNIASGKNSILTRFKTYERLWRWHCTLQLKWNVLYVLRQWWKCFNIMILQMTNKYSEIFLHERKLITWAGLLLPVKLKLNIQHLFVGLWLIKIFNMWLENNKKIPLLPPASSSHWWVLNILLFRLKFNIINAVRDNLNNNNNLSTH